MDNGIRKKVNFLVRLPLPTLCMLLQAEWSCTLRMAILLSSVCGLQQNVVDVDSQNACGSNQTFIWRILAASMSFHVLDNLLEKKLSLGNVFVRAQSLTPIVRGACHGFRYATTFNSCEVTLEAVCLQRSVCSLTRR
jgi:hypothetical protein